MLQVLRTFGRRRRAYTRSAGAGGILLFSKDQLIGSAEVVDESDGGVCVLCADADRQDLRYVLNPASAQVATVRVAWTAPDRAGLQYTRVRNVRGYVTDPDIEHVKEVWRTTAFDDRGHALCDAPAEGPRPPGKALSRQTSIGQFWRDSEPLDPGKMTQNQWPLSPATTARTSISVCLDSARPTSCWRLARDLRRWAPFDGVGSDTRHLHYWDA